MVAQMTLNRNANDGARENPELIQSVYDSLRIDADFLLRGTPEEIHRALNRDDDHGLPRMEVAAKTLLEESFLAPEPHRLRAKAKELLEYIQREDTTFSLERMALRPTSTAIGPAVPSRRPRPRRNARRRSRRRRCRPRSPLPRHKGKALSPSRAGTSRDRAEGARERTCASPPR